MEHLNGDGILKITPSRATNGDNRPQTTEWEDF